MAKPTFPFIFVSIFASQLEQGIYKVSLHSKYINNKLIIAFGARSEKFSAPPVCVDPVWTGRFGSVSRSGSSPDPSRHLTEAGMNIGTQLSLSGPAPVRLPSTTPARSR